MIDHMVQVNISQQLTTLRQKKLKYSPENSTVLRKEKKGGTMYNIE